MKSWFNLVKQDETKFPDFISYYDSKYLVHKENVKLHGKLETQAAMLPSQYEDCFCELQDIEAVLQFFEIKLLEIKSKLFKKYQTSYNRDLKKSEIDVYIEGEQDVVEYKHLINEISLVRNKYISLTGGFDKKSWTIGHIVKLRTTMMEDTLI